MKTEEAVKEGFLKQCIASILILCIAFMTAFAIPQPTQAATTVKKMNGVKAASASYNSIKISWKRISGVTGYKVYRATSKNGTYKLVGTVKKAKTTSFIDKKGVKTGKVYYYKVHAYKKTKSKTTNGVYSKVVKTKAVPGKVKVSADWSYNYESKGYHDILVKWKKVEGADGYVIYRYKGSYEEGKVQGQKYERIKTIKNPNTLTYLDTVATGLEYDTNYCYKMRAYKKVNGKNIYGSYSEMTCGWTDREKSTEMSPEEIQQEEEEAASEAVEHEGSSGGFDGIFGGDF